MKKSIATDLASQIKSAQAYCESEIARMTEDAQKRDKSETRFEAAQELRETYEHFLGVGFTEEQAWELIKIIVAK